MLTICLYIPNRDMTNIPRDSTSWGQEMQAQEWKVYWLTQEPETSQQLLFLWVKLGEWHVSHTCPASSWPALSFSHGFWVPKAAREDKPSWTLFKLLLMSYLLVTHWLKQAAWLKGERNRLYLLMRRGCKTLQPYFFLFLLKYSWHTILC